MKIYEIMELLPHRYPFLLVDRVESINDDLTEIVAYKNVTANEPQFTGHFPNAPVMPGVLIIEAMAQACGILATCRLTEEQRNDKNAIYYFAGIVPFSIFPKLSGGRTGCAGSLPIPDCLLQWVCG